MEIPAKAKYVRIGSRKARRITRLIVGQSVERALIQLKFLPHQSARVVEDVLKSAVANARHNYKLKETPLFVHEAFVDAAASLRRFRPRQRGRAFPIKKRVSHVTVVVSDTRGKK